MKAFSRFYSLLASMGAILAQAAAQGETMPRHLALEAAGGYKSRGHGKGKPGRNYRTGGNVYPEQSLRQENRRFRRAQGGPGLTASNEPRSRYGNIHS